MVNYVTSNIADDHRWEHYDGTGNLVLENSLVPLPI